MGVTVNRQAGQTGRTSGQKENTEKKKGRVTSQMERKQDGQYRVKVTEPHKRM